MIMIEPARAVSFCTKILDARIKEKEEFLSTYLKDML